MLKINNHIEQNISMGNTFSKMQQIKSHYQSPVVTYECLSSIWMTGKIVYFVTTSPTPPQKIFLSDLTLCRPCACCHKCCVFIRATALFCPENTVFRSYSPPLASTIFHPYFREDLSVLWGGM